MPKIRIRYLSDKIEKLRYIDGKSDWIDLRAAETIELKAGESCYIPLGIAMVLPHGYEAHVLPRSSTFRNYGILMSNSMGVVDESYCGDEDEWKMPVYATRDCRIEHTEPNIARVRRFMAAAAAGNDGDLFLVRLAARDHLKAGDISEAAV